MRKTKFMVAAVVCLAAGLACADGYYPEGYHPEGTPSHTSYSAATSFRADASAAKSAPSALDARFRSWAHSIGAGIDLLKEFGLRLVFW